MHTTVEKTDEYWADQYSKRVEFFEQQLGDDVPDSVQEAIDTLGLPDTPEVRRYVEETWKMGLVVGVLGQLVGGPQAQFLMMLGGEVGQLGEAILANFTHEEAAGNVAAEVLVEVLATVTGQDVPLRDDGRVDVGEFLSNEYERTGAEPSPITVGQAIIDAFEACKASTPQAA